jgi:hypothetical protein
VERAPRVGYEFGRSPHWIKMKNPDSRPCPGRREEQDQNLLSEACFFNTFPEKIKVLCDKVLCDYSKSPELWRCVGGGVCEREIAELPRRW